MPMVIKHQSVFQRRSDGTLVLTMRTPSSAMPAPKEKKTNKKRKSYAKHGEKSKKIKKHKENKKTTLRDVDLQKDKKKNDSDNADLQPSSKSANQNESSTQKRKIVKVKKKRKKKIAPGKSTSHDVLSKKDIKRILVHEKSTSQHAELMMAEKEPQKKVKVSKRRKKRVRFSENIEHARHGNISSSEDNVLPRKNEVTENAAAKSRKCLRVMKRKQRRAKNVALQKISEAAEEAVEISNESDVVVPTRQKPKMQSVNAETIPQILQMEGNLVPSETTVEAETRNLNRTNATTGFDGWLEAEIRQMLEDSTQEAFCLETDAKVDQLREDLPRFTRSEEDAMLVEVSPRNQYACEMQRSCESVRMSMDKGISPPIVLGAVRKQGFSNYKQCLLCLRNTATSTLLRLRMDRVGMIRDGCLQTHANYCNINGEYRKIDCLPIRRDRYEGLVLPIVAHRNSGYKAKEFVDTDGKKKRYWCQKEGYPYPSMSMPSSEISSASHASASESNTDKSSDKSPFLLNVPRTKAMI